MSLNISMLREFGTPRDRELLYECIIQKGGALAIVAAMAIFEWGALMISGLGTILDMQKLFGNKKRGPGYCDLSGAEIFLCIWLNTED